MNSLKNPSNSFWLCRNKNYERFIHIEKKYYLCTAFKMVVVAQLVRASDCGSEGRRFESGHPPHPATCGVF
jgi:hypothetical protein